jgi:hypothetical protein
VRGGLGSGHAGESAGRGCGRVLGCGTVLNSGLGFGCGKMLGLEVGVVDG